MKELVFCIEEEKVKKQWYGTLSKYGDEMATVCIPIRRDLLDEVNKICKENGFTKTGLVRNLFISLIEQKKKLTPKLN